MLEQDLGVPLFDRFGRPIALTDGHTDDHRSRNRLRVPLAGVAVLPAVASSTEVADGRLVALPWSVLEFQLVTHLVWHPER